MSGMSSSWVVRHVKAVLQSACTKVHCRLHKGQGVCRKAPSELLKKSSRKKGGTVIADEILRSHLRLTLVSDLPAGRQTRSSTSSAGDPELLRALPAAVSNASEIWKTCPTEGDFDHSKKCAQLHVLRSNVAFEQVTSPLEAGASPTLRTLKPYYTVSWCTLERRATTFSQRNSSASSRLSATLRACVQANPLLIALSFAGCSTQKQRWRNVRGMGSIGGSATSVPQL
jgi:hypothetical protein